VHDKRSEVGGATGLQVRELRRSDEGTVPTSVAPKIRLDHVSKVFRLGSGGEVRALHNVQFDVPDAQFLCLVGPSGCGKSTLLNVVAGLEDPTEGRVLLDAREVRGPGRDRGMVFQEDAIFLWRRVRGNVEFGLEMRRVPKEERRKRSQHFLELVGLVPFANAYPKELSGGMKKRVAIAMVLANEPEVLLMDEPFGSLDYPTKVGLQKVLLDIWAAMRRTTLFVTHDIEEAVFLADRIIVIREGRVVDDIPVEFGRPRDDDLRTATDFQSLKARVWQYIARDAEARPEVVGGGN
jgi:NitT/TauT family transport system ATP-binding protein